MGTVENVGAWYELCRLSAYGCLSTGLDEGLIEIVTPASTIARIQLEYPGMSKVQSAFNKLCIYQWLQKHNSTKQRQARSPEIHTTFTTTTTATAIHWPFFVVNLGPLFPLEPSS